MAEAAASADESKDKTATVLSKRLFTPGFLGEPDWLHATKEGERPQKRYYRARAHCNPLSHNDGFDYPLTPADMDWSTPYPALADPTVRYLDVGCGFGGLTVALAGLFPNSAVLGLEIRVKVCEYVRLRIEASRRSSPPSCQNAWVLRTNAMKYLPNFFHKNQFEAMFFCFPDPHFKAKNFRRRIISQSLLTEYAYLLKENGRLFAITDVEALHQWHLRMLEAHPYFERIPDETLEEDPVAIAVKTTTEEGKKVEASGGSKYFCCYRRRTDQELEAMSESWPKFEGETEGGGEEEEG